MNWCLFIQILLTLEINIKWVFVLKMLAHFFNWIMLIRPIGRLLIFKNSIVLGLIIDIMMLWFSPQQSLEARINGVIKGHKRHGTITIGFPRTLHRTAHYQLLDFLESTSFPWKLRTITIVIAFHVSVTIGLDGKLHRLHRFRVLLNQSREIYTLYICGIITSTISSAENRFCLSELQYT